jgi:hypothetical protein
MTYRQQVVHADGDGGIIIETKQDVTDILERNKVLLEIDKARQKAPDELHLVASIPFTAIDKLNEMGVMRGFTVLDQKALNAWLNKPENKVWKTYRGKL